MIFLSKQMFLQSMQTRMFKYILHKYSFFYVSPINEETVDSLEDVDISQLNIAEDVKNKKYNETHSF